MKDKASLLPLGNYIVKCQNSAGAIALGAGRKNRSMGSYRINNGSKLGMEVEAKADLIGLNLLSCLMAHGIQMNEV